MYTYKINTDRLVGGGTLEEIVYRVKVDININLK